jgi:hypothetical protein
MCEQVIEVDGGEAGVGHGPRQVAGHDQLRPGHGLSAGASPTPAGSTHCLVAWACDPARCQSKAPTEVKLRWHALQ